MLLTESLMITPVKILMTVLTGPMILQVDYGLKFSNPKPQDPKA